MQTHHLTIRAELGGDIDLGKTKKHSFFFENKVENMYQTRMVRRSQLMVHNLKINLSQASFF